jgi:hypothetical protein
LIEALPRQERIKRAVRSLGTRDVTKRFAQIYAVCSEEMKTALWQPELRPGGCNDAVYKVINY